MRSDHPLAEQAVGVTPCSQDSGWARERMRQPEALTLLPAQPDRVVIGHPDTGWARHHQLPTGSLDLARARNAFTGGDGRPRPGGVDRPLRRSRHGNGIAPGQQPGRPRPDSPADTGSRPRVRRLGLRGAGEVRDQRGPVLHGRARVVPHVPDIPWRRRHLHQPGRAPVAGSARRTPPGGGEQHHRRRCRRAEVPRRAVPGCLPGVRRGRSASTPNDRPWGPTTASPTIDISAPGHLVCVADFAAPGITEITKAGSGTSVRGARCRVGRSAVDRQVGSFRAPGQVQECAAAAARVPGAAAEDSSRSREAERSHGR